MMYTQSRISRSSKNYTQLRIAELHAKAYHFGMVLRVRQLREARGWTQMELAERAGLRQATISKVESRPEKTELATLIKIATAFEMQVGDLVTGLPGIPDLEAITKDYLRLDLDEKVAISKQLRALSALKDSAA